MSLDYNTKCELMSSFIYAGLASNSDNTDKFQKDLIDKSISAAQDILERFGESNEMYHLNIFETKGTGPR